MLLRHQNIDFRRIQWENCVFGEKIGDFFKTTVFGIGWPIWEMPGGGGGVVHACDVRRVILFAHEAR